MYWLLDTLPHWSGPVSIALFTPDVEYHVSIVYIQYLRKCFPKMEQQVEMLKMLLK